MSNHDLQQEVLTPEEVVRRYPHALYAIERKLLVARAHKAGDKVRVFYRLDPWGLTVLQMEIVPQGGI